MQPLREGKGMARALRMDVKPEAIIEAVKIHAQVFGR
jgi:hypothetical protein